MPLPVAVLLGGAAAGAVAVSSKVGGQPVPPQTNVAPNGGQPISPTRGMTVGDALAGVSTVGTRTKMFTPLTQRVGAAYIAGVLPGEPSGASSSTFDADLQHKLDTINQYASSAWDNADASTRAATADALNKSLKLDPPLTGNEDWDAMGAIAGGAAGAAACAATGLGAIVTPLCVTAGTFLGTKLADLVNKNETEIKDWFKSRWSQIETWVQDAGHTVEAGVQNAIDWLGGLI